MLTSANPRMTINIPGRNVNFIFCYDLTRETEREENAREKSDFEMQKLGFPAMKSLDQMRSSMAAGSGRNLTFSSRQQPHDSVSSGNFSNLKSTAGPPLVRLCSRFDDFAPIVSVIALFWLFAMSPLLLFAEKLVKEQASMKSDLELAVFRIAISFSSLRSASLQTFKVWSMWLRGMLRWCCYDCAFACRYCS